MDAGLWAYPVLLATVYGVSRVGRHEPSVAFHWLRMGTMGALLGAILAIQVKLIVAGRVTEPVPLVAGSLSIAGVVTLVGLYIYDRSQLERARIATNA